jgi:hypothetical protein
MVLALCAGSQAADTTFSFEHDLDTGKLMVSKNQQPLLEVIREVNNQKWAKYRFETVDFDGKQATLTFLGNKEEVVKLMETPEAAGETLRVPTTWEFSAPAGNEAAISASLQVFVSYADNPGLVISTDKGEIIDFTKADVGSGESLLATLKEVQHPTAPNVTRGISSLTLSNLGGETFTFEFPASADVNVFFPTWIPTWTEDRLVGFKVLYTRAATPGESSGSAEWSLRKD